jgi:hypothetical protein
MQLLEKHHQLGIKSTEDNKVLNLKSESAERIEGLRIPAINRSIEER